MCFPPHHLSPRQALCILRNIWDVSSGRKKNGVRNTSFFWCRNQFASYNFSVAIGSAVLDLNVEPLPCTSLKILVARLIHFPKWLNSWCIYRIGSAIKWPTFNEEHLLEYFFLGRCSSVSHTPHWGYVFWFVASETGFSSDCCLVYIQVSYNFSFIWIIPVSPNNFYSLIAEPNSLSYFLLKEFCDPM